MRTPASSPLCRGLAAAATAVLLTTTTACATPGAAAPTTNPMPASMDGMSMAAGSDGVGLSATSTSGYRFVPATTSVPAGHPAAFRFQILDPRGTPVTRYQTEQTKQLHFYVIRTDLTGFQHLHPTLDPDGTWTAPLQALAPGTYRAYPQFTALPQNGQGVPLVLGQQFTVTGPTPKATPLPPSAASTQVDGYTLTLTGRPAVGADAELAITVTKGGKPVTDLQPYLDTYAHLTAFHQGDLAFAHLHPTGTVQGDHGGPQLQFHATLPEPGAYRLYLQFQTAAVLHTATITLTT